MGGVAQDAAQADRVTLRIITSTAIVTEKSITPVRDDRSVRAVPALCGRYVAIEQTPQAKSGNGSSELQRS